MPFSKRSKNKFSGKFSALRAVRESRWCNAHKLPRSRRKASSQETSTVACRWPMRYTHLVFGLTATLLLRRGDRMLRHVVSAMVFNFFLLATHVSAQDNLFTPHHVAKLRMVTSAVISPDGAQVAYILGVPRQLPKEKDGLAWAELHVVDSNGTNTPFITGQVNIDSIDWTPDGKSISFLTKRDGEPFKSLYVIPVRGGESRKVQSHGSDIQGYSWSPDGKQVAFLATEPTPQDKKTRKEQGFDQEIYEEAVPFVRVWTANVENGKATMIKLTGSASELHWSPVGDKLAVALAPTPHVDDSLMFRKVHIVDLKSGEAKNLNNPGKMGQLAWSLDGKMLALISGADKHDPMQGRIFVATEQARSWVDVLPSFLGHVESIAWKD